jgi:hypothetical protein
MVKMCPCVLWWLVIVKRDDQAARPASKAAKPISSEIWIDSHLSPLAWCLRTLSVRSISENSYARGLFVEIICKKG